VARSSRRLLRGAKALDYGAERAHHALVALSDQRGKNVLADAVAPEMIAAVAPRMSGAVEIYPVVLRTARKMVSAVTHSVAFERETALEAGNVDTPGHLEIDSWFHYPAPIPAYKFAKNRKLRLLFYPADAPLFLIFAA
jgi:hypothetical protein